LIFLFNYSSSNRLNKVINIDFSKVAKWLSYKQNIEALRGASFIRASSPKDYPSFNSVTFTITPKDGTLIETLPFNII